ncbi:MAG: hypothetical protein JRN68_03495 [Nitrososphaerota archaeon]|nr:hypothetical protein [Nitrososphaerota archaeon]
MMEFDYTKYPEIEIRETKLNWNSYDIEYATNIKGTLKAISIPMKAYLLDGSHEPPQIAVVWQNLSWFQSTSKAKGKPDSRPITPDLYDSTPKTSLIDGTSITGTDEPFNRYVIFVEGKAYTGNARTSLVNLEISTERKNQFGDPVFWVNLQAHITLEKRKGTASV